MKKPSKLELVMTSKENELTCLSGVLQCPVCKKMSDYIEYKYLTSRAESCNRYESY